MGACAVKNVGLLDLILFILENLIMNSDFSSSEFLPMILQYHGKTISRPEDKHKPKTISYCAFASGNK
jgi:hypothetical protein